MTYLQALPAEPAAGEADVVQVAVRMPTGTRFTRRYHYLYVTVPGCTARLQNLACMQSQVMVQPLAPRLNALHPGMPGLHTVWLPGGGMPCKLSLVQIAEILLVLIVSAAPALLAL